MIDTYPIPRTAAELKSQYDARRLFLTEQGVDLLQTDPAVVENFMATAYQLLEGPPVKPGTFEWVGRGQVSEVYGLPGAENKCVKIASPNTQHDSWRTGLVAPVPNLTLEARFMKVIGEQLAKKPEAGIKSPVQYGAVKFADGSALLLERVPSDFISLRSLILKARGDSEREAFLNQQAVQAYRRTRPVLSNPLVRLASADMHGTLGKINAGNFLVDRNRLADGPFYLIDLVGHAMFRRAYAAGAVALLGT
jgi:hypothetical protein